MANLSRVLYFNYLKASLATIAYSGTETDGFNYQNCLDGKDFSTFQPESNATTNLDFTMTGAATLNTLGVFVEKTGASGAFVINLYGETSPGVFTLLDVITDSADGKLELSIFANSSISAGRKIRLQFTTGAGTYKIRNIMAGLLTEFERGQYAGVNPTTLTQGIVQSNNISENGSILGTNVKRVDVKTSINLQYCTESWVRGTWENFAAYAAKGQSFYYQWNPSEYPDEVVFCVASKIIAPKNTTPTPLMSVSMPLICRQADA